MGERSAARVVDSRCPESVPVRRAELGLSAWRSLCSLSSVIFICSAAASASSVVGGLLSLQEGGDTSRPQTLLFISIVHVSFKDIVWHKVLPGQTPRWASRSESVRSRPKRFVPTWRKEGQAMNDIKAAVTTEKVPINLLF